MKDIIKVPSILIQRYALHPRRKVLARFYQFSSEDTRYTLDERYNRGAINSHPNIRVTPSKKGIIGLLSILIRRYALHPR